MNMNPDILSKHQAVRWGIMYYVGSSILVIPSKMAIAAKQDAWISVLLVLLIQLSLVPLWMLLAKQLKGRTIYAYIKGALGNGIGSVTYLLWLLGFPFLIFIYTIRNLGDFITGIVMPETPIEIIHLVYLIIVVFGLRLGLKSIGRAAELLFLVFVFFVGVYVLALLPETHPSWLHPVGHSGIKHILAGALPLMSIPYMETFILCHLLPRVEDSGGSASLLVKTTLISGGILFIVIVLCIVVLNPNLTAQNAYPTFYMGLLINIGNFLERVEVVITIIWYITTFFRLSLTLYVCSSGLSEIFRIPGYKLAVAPIAIIALPMALVVWPNEGYHQEFFEVWGIYAIFPGLGYPLLLIAAAACREWTSRGNRHKTGHRDGAS